MATRTIVTSQPDVECDVCERRLLRGEQPDVFVGAGRRRIVCELCAPRAAHEGWMRETDSQSLAMPPMRPRRGRSLIDRLRQVGKQPGDAPGAAAAGVSAPGEAPYDLFAGPEHAAGAEPVAARPSRVQAQPIGSHASSAAAPAAASPHDAEQLVDGASETNHAHAEVSPYLRDAIAVFNSSEFPRRVAGVTRSLGAPMVSVRSAEHLDSVVSIVVAWELCWYRYEVDLSEPVAEAQVMAQGTELGELAREDRLGNAAATDAGMLLLAVP
jgi:hypothetical protein